MNEIRKDLKDNNTTADKKQAFNEGIADNTNQLTDTTIKGTDKTNKTPIDRKTKATVRK
jgi:hypothetical protein